VSPMIPQASFPDGELFDVGMAEVSGDFEEQVTVKRFTGATGGDPADGQAPTKTYTSFQTMALIDSLSAQEQASPTGFFMAGDLRAEFHLQVYGSEGGAYDGAAGSAGDQQNPGRYSDIIIYRNREYKVVGHVDRIHYAGQYFWTATLRQSKS